MKYFLTLLLLLGSWLGAWAEDEENETFKYSLRTSGEIFITQYKGNDKTLIIPREIVAKDGRSHPVTSIRALMYNSLKNTEEVFIPSSVTLLCYSSHLFDLCTNTKLKTVVFESSNFKIETQDKKIFAFSKDLNNISFDFDNIIILGESSHEMNHLIAYRNNAYSSHFTRAGYIHVSYKGLTEKQPVRMYLYRKDDAIPFTFNNERLGYLLSALEKSGKNLSEIEEIDLSEMSSEANIVFEDLSLPETCSNAHIITNSIEDLTDFVAPTTNRTDFISYSRTNTKDWNSVCLPFAIQESDFPEGTKIYTMTGGSEDKILLTRIGESESLEAGTPCFIYSEAEAWDLKINATIPANIAPAPVTQEGNSWVLKGCFAKTSLEAGKYKLNSAGTDFVRTTGNSNAWPFRCYIEEKKPSQGAPARLGVGVDEDADITLVPNDAEPSTVKLIDLMGRPRQGNAPGLYIRSKH